MNRSHLSPIELIVPDSPRPVSTPLPSPGHLKLAIPLSPGTQARVAVARSRLGTRVQRGIGAPIAIVGPCSIHCRRAALEYAERLLRLQERLGQDIQLVMRAYFEKPRTTVGWKGFLYDPELDGSDDLAAGLVQARQLLVELAEMGVSTATEILDPLFAPYIDDVVSWVAIGARTSESQIHRQMASGLNCAVGFKNGTDGSIDVALSGIEAASVPHSHLGLDASGRVALLRSQGNPLCHVVLRGGARGPNYDEASVISVSEQLHRRGHAPRVLIDCSHQNSGKDHTRQPVVARAVMAQMGRSEFDVMGLMLESHLFAGCQRVEAPRRYGMSVTDACMDITTTEVLLEELASHKKSARAPSVQSAV